MNSLYYIPGNKGKNCPFNGLNTDALGNFLDCKCDNCDYALCCFDAPVACSPCTFPLCDYANALKAKQN